MEAAQSPWPALGTLLVRDGAITAAQLETALEEKRADPARRIGEILVSQGAASRTQIARVLAEQHELPFVELNATMIESEAAMLLPEKLAKRYTAIPINIEGDNVIVAVADPTNVMFSDELRLAIGMSVRVVVAPADAIEFAIQKTYDGGTVVELMAVEDEADVVEDDATNVDLSHESPAVVFVNRSIAKALDIGASDIHFTPQAKRLYVRARVDGVMRELSSINSSSGAAITSRLKIMGGLDIAERRAPQDGRVSIRRGAADIIDVRVAVLPTAHGEKTTLRILAQGDAPSSLEDPRDVAAERGGAAQVDRATVRRHRRGGPNRLGQDDDAVRLPAGAQQARGLDRDPRGPRRVSRGRPRPDRDQPTRRAHLRERPADGAPLRPGHHSRRRDSRRGDREHRVPRCDDRAPRALDTSMRRVPLLRSSASSTWVSTAG